jgi:hypothetical protein
LGEEKMDGFGNSRYVFVEFLGEISFLRPPRTLMHAPLIFQFYSAQSLTI